MASHADLAAALDRLSVAMYHHRATAAGTLPDLNATDLLALTIVRRAGQITPGDLALAMCLTAGGVNGVVRRVIDIGLLDRTPVSHTDVRLRITQPGEELMTAGAPGWDAQMLGQLAARAEASDMMDLLTVLAEAVEERAEALSELAAEAHRAARGSVQLPLRWG